MSRNMIVVVECKTVLADRDELIYETMKSPNDSLRAVTCENAYEKVEVTQEHIRGRVFCLPNGQRITLGMSIAAAKSLAVPFEIIEEQQETIEKQHGRLITLQHNLDISMKNLAYYKNANFWQRLKYLFIGGS